MLNLICVDENNVAYVETDCKKVFGIVNAFHVTDEEGAKVEGDVCSILECYTEINQDFENEANVISFAESNGESYELHIDVNGINLVGTND